MMYMALKTNDGVEQTLKAKLYYTFYTHTRDTVNCRLL